MSMANPKFMEIFMHILVFSSPSFKNFTYVLLLYISIPFMSIRLSRALISDIYTTVLRYCAWGYIIMKEIFCVF